jgi:hypothetical protein
MTDRCRIWDVTDRSCCVTHDEHFALYPFSDGVLYIRFGYRFLRISSPEDWYMGSW